MLRIIKTIVGWLCFVSLLAAPLLAGYGAYLSVAPYFRGAVLKYVDWHDDPTAIIKDLESHPTTKTDGARLRRFALHVPLQVTVEKEWGALRQIYDPIPEGSTPIPVAAAVLLDKDGRAVASYPDDLAARVPRLTATSDKEPFIDLGSQDSADLMTRIQVFDGRTTPETVGGLTCRRNKDSAQDMYLYFAIDDSFAYQGSRPDMDITIRYYDAGCGPLELQYDGISQEYDGSSHEYQSGGAADLHNTNTWKYKTYHVTDGYFGNRQNGGADFRIYAPAGTTFYLDTVRCRSLAGWRERLAPLMQSYASEGSAYLEIYPVEYRQSRTVGTLAVLWNYPFAIAAVPASSRVTSFSPPSTYIELGAIALVLFGLLLPLWVGLDAAWRGTRPFAWGLLALFTNLLGLMAYLIGRPSSPRPCPNCGQRVLAKYIRCPTCGATSLSKCPTCRTPLKQGWQFCPICAGTPTGRVEEVYYAPGAEAPGMPLAENAGTVRVEGANLRIVVVGDQSGAPIANAGVLVEGPAPIRGLTNAAGTFDARAAKTGPYVIRATAPGYEPAQADVEVTDGEPKVVRLTLKAVPAGIVGRVVERASLSPVIGAYVYLDTGQVDISTVTGDDGRYILEDIPPGTYAVAVNADGFAPQTKLAETLPGQRIPADFALEAPASKEDE